MSGCSQEEVQTPAEAPSLGRLNLKFSILLPQFVCLSRTPALDIPEQRHGLDAHFFGLRNAAKGRALMQLNTAMIAMMMYRDFIANYCACDAV
jgi:hypothetical protein